MAQGPKGLVQLAVINAASETEPGKALLEKTEQFSQAVGEKIANEIEGTKLDSKFETDKYLIGGGQFMASVLTGVLSKSKGAKEPTSVSVVDGTGAKGSVPSKTAVQGLEVDAYKNLKAREVVGDGLEHDHIPSFAALRTAKEAELGRPLTELETKTLYQNSTAVEVPRDVHIAGPTYGGKNTPAQIQQDAADLCGAVCRDTEALRANLNSRGYDSKLVDETVQKLVERNRNTGVIK